MSFFALIATNLMRHRIRTLIGVAGIALGVAAMLSVITILQGAIRMFERILNSDSEIIVFERNVSDLFFSSVPTNSIAKLSESSLVDHADPVIFGIVSTPGNPVVTCFGVGPQDSRLRTAKWQQGNVAAFAKGGKNVALGARAADFLKANLGDVVSIGRGQFTVAGVIRSENGFEDGGVFMPFETAQDFFHKNGVASIATVKLKNKESKEQFKQFVKEQFPDLIALEHQEFSRSYSQFKILQTTAWTVGACAFCLGGLSVANTMIMSVFTRIREIAILRVCGFSRSQVGSLILGESGIIAACGILLGVALSHSSMLALRSLPLLQGYIDPRLEPKLLGEVALLALLTGLAGSLYPAWYAARIRAAQALRFE